MADLPKVFVLADLKPKERPRSGRGNTYTPKATQEAEELVAWSFRQRNPHHRADADTRWGVRIQVWPRTKRKADVDNLAKTVLDGLNGVVYKDDAQVDALTITRHWSERPRPNVVAVVACYPLT